MRNSFKNPHRVIGCFALVVPGRSLLFTFATGCLLVCCRLLCGSEPVDFQRDVGPILQQRCLSCHNDRDHRGGLSLQSAEMAGRGGESGTVIEPGDAESSYLLDAVIPSGGMAEMPKGEAPLGVAEVETIRRWIASGAVWPKGLELEPPVLWSLRPLIRPGVPADIAGTAEFPLRNSIDSFAAARYRDAELQSAPQADRRTLIRRLYIDITGLPPSPVDVEAFVANDHPTAYEHLVDKLLESPHYGERWGRYWLDLARYADSEGYLGDNLRPHAWVYREWVIDAINRDLPFDQFSLEQLAGDLLEKPTLEQRIATGFHRNTLRNTEAGVDLELYRTKEIIDRVNTTGMVWLGLTLGCAECHDHKNDPISQTEFYRLFAFFNNADEVGISVNRPWETAEYEQGMLFWQPAWDDILSQLGNYEQQELSDDQRSAIAKALAGGSKLVDWKSIVDLYQTKKPGWDDVKKKLDACLTNKPAAPATKSRAFAKRINDRRDTFVLIRGIYSRHGEKVQPDTPAMLPDLIHRAEQPDRLDLARWLFHKDNPLTGRVSVNQIWQRLFGQGLVSTPNDFGNKGARPTHPQLLDWLATEYRRLGWSRKAMIRLIVKSSMYRLASAANSVPTQQNVNNLLLWRQNSYRVDAEIVRDLHLSASGLLDRTIGRRGVRPPLPDFVAEVGRSVKWPVSQGSERYRRGMYILFKRTVPFPMLMTFDAPDSAISCSQRERSNTPLQALTLLNDPEFYECARILASSMIEQHPDDPSAAIDDIFLTCLGRRPVDQERSFLMSAWRDLIRINKIESLTAKSTVDNVDEEILNEEPRLASMIAVTRIVMNLDEFITRD